MSCLDNIKIDSFLGAQVSHNSNVNLGSISGVFSDCEKYRYTLEFAYLNNANTQTIRNKSLTIIMKNPSSANKEAADNTIRRVQNYVYHNFIDVLNVKILNLFAIRATNASDVNRILRLTNEQCITGQNNNEHIIKLVSSADYIIVAWGGSSGINKNVYNNRIEFVADIIVKHKRSDTQIFRIQEEVGSNRYPFHPCYSKVNHSLFLWENIFTNSD